MRNYLTYSVNGKIQSIWFEENGYRFSFNDADPANSDYQQYLAWVAEGNTAEEWSPDATV